MRLIFAALAALSLYAADPLRAQCPDGSPPPCPQATRRATIARPLDDRNWLILPFDNLARDPALDLVRDASVTLLYTAMSQWSDILVVDDTRVADLMRGVPAGGRIGQEQAFELARRVGAGKLVMGTLLKEGARTRVQAAVFDVRAGRRLRSPSTMTVGTDSLSAVFASLAQQVLSVPAPPGINVAETGTSNSDALRAYVAGLDAERRWASDTAVMHFRRAVALDTAFGLAWYHIYWNIGALPEANADSLDRALAAAQRFSAGMPRREAGQVASLASSRRGDWTTACAIVDRMLAADSLDAWAWWRKGVCRWQVLANDTGTVPDRFRSDNGRLADWRRAAALDTTFLNPVWATFNLLQSPVRGECQRARVSTCPHRLSYRSARLLDHDTLVQRPYPAARGLHLYASEPGQFEAYRRRLEMVRDMASAFVASNPDNWGGRYFVSYALMNLGDLDGAERELRAVSGAVRFVSWRRLYYLRLFEIELRRERPAAAAVFLDSLYGDRTAGEQPQAGAILGRFAMDARAIYAGNDSMIRMRHALLPIYAGVLPADYDSLVARYARAFGALRDRDPEIQAQVRDDIISLTTLVSFRARRTRPAADTANPHPLVRSQAWFALRDTARSRQQIRLAEEEIARRPGWAWDDGSWLFAAEGCVLLGDSAAALRLLRDWAGRWESMPSNTPQLLGEFGWLGNSPARAWGRTWLLYGDLALAAGDREQARRAYRMVVGMWEGGEAPVQPMVARARAALAGLGP